MGAAMGALCHILRERHGLSGLEKRAFWHRFRTSLQAKRAQLQRMRGFKEKTFNDRLEEQAKAKAALLERARKANPANDPEFAKRQEERKRIAEERETREKTRAEARAEELRLAAEQKAAAEVARLAAERLAAEEAEKAKRAEADKLVTLLADQKAARDARYAARKTRQKGKR
ncbi:MAG TPA: DUF6481 family protein [Rhizomicrobium sp.]|jgi:hypothetical protein|nr:DUF6481 family protein [Rhizomicrobium sp.]